MIDPVTIGSTVIAPDPVRESARDLQVALFTELLRHGGFAEAFATGSDALDSLTTHVLQKVAEDMAGADTRFAAKLYEQLSAAERGSVGPSRAVSL